MRFRHSYPAALILLAIALIPVPSPTHAQDKSSKDKKKLTFERDILPIFRAKCIRCHAGVEPKAGLNLTSPSSLLTGGKSGAALRINAAEFSLLYEKVSSNQMPPVGQKLTADEKGLIRTWINEGANGVDPATFVDRSDDLTGIELWSFRSPKQPDVPVVNSDRVRNPIDAFVLARLAEESLAMAPEADRATLLRRASYDLIGLPPTPQDVAQFIGDGRPGAYDRMINRLLANPHYGERWARHWLDVAGYADSAGILSEDRPLPLIYRYRDYVVRAFNSDKPYGRFLQEQIAGDELTDYWSAFETQDRLPEEVVEGIIATGFLRTAADPSRPDFTTIKNADAQYFYPTLFDTLQIVSSSTMGLTMQCARCHSHKFDPIPQVDYYRMQAVFMSAYRPQAWIPQMNRRLHIASKKEKDAAAKKNAEVDANVRKLNDEIAVLKKTSTDQLFETSLAKLPEEIRTDVKAAFGTAKDKRSEIQKYLVTKFEKKLKPQGKELETALAELPDYRKTLDELNGRIASEQRRRWLFDEVRALYDQPGEVTTPVLLRGDPLTPGPPVEPGVISTLEAPQPFEWSMPGKDAKTSGRRLAFARWLTQPEHPLTARVMVNRIWMHHFGTGLVSTPDDFGVSGSPPSHPKLLDWLAVEFVNSGWSVKHIHRLILSSTTWRQRSRVSEAHLNAGTEVDPDNRLLWRQTLRRLEAEPLRDAFLAASGSLRETMYGYPSRVARQKNGEVIIHTGNDPYRRSIYTQILRLNPDTMLEVFDQPAISVNCTQRMASTVSTQALTLLNSDMMVRAAESFRDRVVREAADKPASYAVLTAFGRRPSESERAALLQFLNEQTQRYVDELDDAQQKDPAAIDAAEKQALADLCHMLLSANEFAYVD